MLVVLAACGPDRAVVPEVVSAAITSDSGVPVALARIDVVLELTAGSRAEGAVSLEHATLEQGGSEVLDLDLDFPDTFDAVVTPEEAITAPLVNMGTSNRTLEPLCGQTLDLRVAVALDELQHVNGAPALELDTP